MPNETVAGFWSYAHEDDKLDGGAILGLARLITEEYNLLSGNPLELFVDQSGISWGQEWRARIDAALSQTTFFIPIVTPRYFMRPECCRELLEFAAKAKSLGVDELLLPILYVSVEDFSPESTDEAISLIAKTQYVDWRDMRLLEPGSRGYRTAVNGLVQRLLIIAREVAEKQLDSQVNSGPESNSTDGIADIVEQASRFLPDWLDAVVGEEINDLQIMATWNQVYSAIARTQRSNAPASAVLGAKIRAAKEILPLVERKQRDAKVYLARSVELDPLVSSLARQVTDHPDSFELVTPIREAIDKAIEQIHLGEERDRKNAGRPSLRDHFAKWDHLGRLFQRCNSVMRYSDRLVVEANDIVLRWDAELQRLT